MGDVVLGALGITGGGGAGDKRKQKGKWEANY